MMKQALCLLYFLLTGVVMVAAQSLNFSYVDFTSGDVTLPYRMATTAATANSPALVVYLHGGSSKGTDNEAQLNEKGLDSICNYLVNNCIEALVVAPQCPPTMSWGGKMNVVLRNMVTDIVSKHGADTSSIYLFGGSMGGTGTWGMLSAYPRMWAAAMPVAGNPSRCVADSLLNVPIYAVMGDADAIMSEEPVSSLIAWLNASGNDSRLDIEAGWNHETTCIESYTAKRLCWVFSHHKLADTGVEQHEADTTVIASVCFDISGRRLPGPPENGIYLRRDIFSNGTSRVEKCIATER